MVDKELMICGGSKEPSSCKGYTCSICGQIHLGSPEFDFRDQHTLVCPRCKVRQVLDSICETYGEADYIFNLIFPTDPRHS